MNARIEPLAESHFEALRDVLDTVARERRYLALTQAPPHDAAVAFYRNVLAQDHPYFVALLDEQVVGWCDVLPLFGEARRHAGALGMGLVPHARRRGLGTRLLSAAINQAWQRGFTRIELTVRTDNLAAIALYERLGFEREGLQRRAMRVDGVYHDTQSMALVRDDTG